MYWMLRNLRFFLFASAMAFVTANDQCRTEEKIQCKTEVNIQGMALKRFVFKRWSVAAPHLCDVKCGQEITCQSYNYNKKYQICELNNRTKEARPENFLSARTWFYIRRLNGRGKKSQVYVPKWFFVYLDFLHPEPTAFLPIYKKWWWEKKNWECILLQLPWVLYLNYRRCPVTK